MLIIEGADLLGKTTLCHKLVKKLNDVEEPHIYAHFTRLPRAFDFFENYLQRASLYVVQDRFHMSEICYAYARDDRTRLSPSRYMLIDAYLRWNACAFTVVLFTTAGPRSTERPEMYSPAVIERANEAFTMIATKGVLGTRDRISVDFALDVCDGYPTDRDVQLIFDMYRERLDGYRLIRKIR